MSMTRSGFLMVVAAVSAVFAGESRAFRRSGRYASLLVFWLGLGFAGLSMQAQNFGEWGPAQNMDPLREGLNTPKNDGCPIESPDGRTLFIATDRDGDLDIWVASRDGNGGWEAPEPLPFPVNHPTANDFCPTPLPGNALLFVSNRANNCGGSSAGNDPDIYYTRQHPVKGWLPPQPLSCAVNSGAQEFSPSLAESEGVTMLFFSSNRGGTHKIYMSTLSANGSWSEASAVMELNWEGAEDARPNVRKDGLEIVFDSTRGPGPPDIFTAHRSSIFDPWSTPVRLGSNVNSPGAETRPSISRDGERLYFGSSRANGPLDSGGDVFMSTRKRH